MVTFLRNGPLERVSFSDTEIDDELLAPTEPRREYGLHTHRGFQRVINGNAVEGPEPRERRARLRRRALLCLFVVAALSAAALKFLL